MGEQFLDSRRSHFVGGVRICRRSFIGTRKKHEFFFIHNVFDNVYKFPAHFLAGFSPSLPELTYVRVFP